MKKLFIILSFAAMVLSTGCKKDNQNGEENGGNNGGDSPTPTETTFTVTFNANGGSGEMQPQSFTAGETKALSANAYTYEYHKFKNWNTMADGSGDVYTNRQKITLTQNITIYAQWGAWNGELNGHEWIDLDLPSGTLWATCNIGADDPTAFGDYFAWGEILPQTDNSYKWSSYKYANGTSFNDPRLTKYCNKANRGDNGFTDTLTILLPEDDAATVAWGVGWRMPTQGDFNELKNCCQMSWQKTGGIDGILFERNGRTLFLPAAGYYQNSNSNFDGYSGYYWSRSLDTNDPRSAYFLLFDWQNDMWANVVANCNIRSYDRSCGRTVRAVCSPQN